MCLSCGTRSLARIPDAFLTQSYWKMGAFGGKEPAGDFHLRWFVYVGSAEKFINYSFIVLIARCSDCQANRLKVNTTSYFPPEFLVLFSMTQVQYILNFIFFRKK